MHIYNSAYRVNLVILSIEYVKLLVIIGINYDFSQDYFYFSAYDILFNNTKSGGSKMKLEGT